MTTDYSAGMLNKCCLAVIAKKVQPLNFSLVKPGGSLTSTHDYLMVAEKVCLNWELLFGSSDFNTYWSGLLLQYNQLASQPAIILALWPPGRKSFPLRHHKVSS